MPEPTQPRDTNARLDELARVLAELRSTIEALTDTDRARRSGYLDCAGLVVRDRDGRERITLEVSAAGVATLAVRHPDDPDHGVRLVAGVDRELDDAPQAMIELVGEMSSNELNEHMGGLVEGLRAELCREVRTERLVVVRPDGFERLTTDHGAGGEEFTVRVRCGGSGTSVALVASEAVPEPYAGVFVEAHGEICGTFDATARDGEYCDPRLDLFRGREERTEITPAGVSGVGERLGAVEASMRMVDSALALTSTGLMSAADTIRANLPELDQ